MTQTDFTRQTFVQLLSNMSDGWVLEIL